MDVQLWHFLGPAEDDLQVVSPAARFADLDTAIAACGLDREAFTIPLITTDLDALAAIAISCHLDAVVVLDSDRVVAHAFPSDTGEVIARLSGGIP